MTMSKLNKTFAATLQRSPNKGGWTYVVMPGSAQYFGTRSISPNESTGSGSTKRNLYTRSSLSWIPCGAALLEQSRDFLKCVFARELQERSPIRMAGRNISVVIEQHAHGLGLAPINHPHERGLPVFRFGFAGEAFGERPVERLGVARQDISDAVEPVIIERVEQADRSFAKQHVAQAGVVEEVRPSDCCAVIPGIAQRERRAAFQEQPDDCFSAPAGGAVQRGAVILPI